MKRYVLVLVMAVGLLAGPAALGGLAEATSERRPDQWSQWGRPRSHHEHHWNSHRHHHQWKHVVPAAAPVWQPGYWYWNGWAWEWVQGHWVR